MINQISARAGKPIPQLDAIRGIAAATVVVWHWFSMASLRETWFADVNEFWYRGSEIAVTTFFVLSGTVLTLSIRRNASLPGYFLRRVLRIMPLVILVVSVSFAGMWCLRDALDIGPPWRRYSDFTAWRWLSNVLVLDTHFNPPGWTLRYELPAYLLMPFLVLAIIRSGTARLIHAAAFAALAGIVCFYWMTPAAFLTFMPMFIPGVALGLMIPVVQFRPMPLLLAGSVALAILIQIEETHYDLALFVATACALLIAGGMTIPWLANPKLRWLGDISFGLYLWHYPILWASFYLLGSFVGTRDLTVWLWVGALSFPLILAVSHLSYRYFEKPIMGLASSRPPVQVERLEASQAG